MTDPHPDAVMAPEPRTDPATREPFRPREWAASLSLDELRAVTTAGDEWSETGVIPDGSILRTIDDGFANLGILRLTAVNDAWRELAKRLDGAAAGGVSTPPPDTDTPTAIELAADEMLTALYRIRADRPSAHSDAVWSMMNHAIEVGQAAFDGRTAGGSVTPGDKP